MTFGRSIESQEAISFLSPVTKFGKLNIRLVTIFREAGSEVVVDSPR